MQVVPYDEEHDYPRLARWWEAREHAPKPKDWLSQDSGWIVEGDTGEPLGAIFVDPSATSRMAYVSQFVTRPNLGIEAVRVWEAAIGQVLQAFSDRQIVLFPSEEINSHLIEDVNFQEFENVTLYTWPPLS